MSYMLSIHSTKAFREFLLPAINNSEDSIILDKDIFSLEKDIELHLEVIEKHWHFLNPDKYGYRIMDTLSEQDYAGIDLKNGNLLTAILASGEKISIMVDEMLSPFKVFQKFDLQKNETISIGKNVSCDIVYDTRNLVSGEHAVIRMANGQCVIEDKGINGVFVNSRRIVGAKQLEFGDCINIFGLSIVYLDDILAVNSQNDGFKVNRDKLKPHISPKIKVNEQNINVGKKVLYHRSPRQIYKIDTDPIEIEAPPQQKQMEKKSMLMVIGPSLTMAIPMLLGSGLYILCSNTGDLSSSAFMYVGLVTAIASAVIGTIWALVNLREEKKKTREAELHRFEAYSEYLIKCSNEIKAKYEKNIYSVNTMYISSEECCRYNSNNALLWNRNPNHADCLSYRLGIGDMPFQAKIIIPKERFTLINDSLAEKPALIQQSFKELHNVPICADLKQNRIIGIVGGEKKKGALDIMHIMVSQIAVSNCYTDVKMAFIYDEGEDDAADWEYMKWFPHVWSSDKKTRYIAKNRVETGDVLYEITNVLRNRVENRNPADDKKDKLDTPQFIIFISNPEMLEGELINKYIIDEKNRDITTILLTDTYEKLPNECKYIIQNDSVFRGMYGIEDDIEERKSIVFDIISNIQLEKLARTLSDIEVHETQSGGDIPNTLTFFDMYGVKNLQELNVLDKWRKNRTYDSMKALIGQKAGGTDWYLDIHEKYHGPHGLIAGTTGSGKSETLQTYILSLAINFSPDDVGFFIIDYKGGGMANLFNGLPHMIGQISNLSGNQVKRAMVSIKSENRRRQRIFNEHGVNNINLYTRLYKNNEATIPVPHMFIIIDEFAELKREEPEFMKELISVAQVGRSLGVHLILATQKPSGTVDDNIWSNSKFRLCLRVQDRQDSNDMLHRPDAAYITQAGRCYMQVGNDELFELFQSGFSGAEYDEENGNRKSNIAQMVSMTGKAALIGNRTKLKQKNIVRRNWIKQLLIIILKKNTSEKIYDNDGDMGTFVKDIFKEFSNRNIDYAYNEYNAKRIEELIKVYETVKNNSTKGTYFEEFVDEVIKYADINKIKLPEKKQKTQLDAVVEYLAQLAKENGYVNDLQLWLPVLPILLYIDQLPSYNESDYFDGNVWAEKKAKEWTLDVLLGFYDDPVNQAQDTLKLDLAQNGHHAILGTATSGKSTLLQTLVYGLVTKYSPQEVNIYAIDFSANMLSAFEKMPHVGGVMIEGEDDKIAKFFNMLNGILSERKKLFKGGNYSQYVRVNGIVIPSIVIVIDNYSNFRNKTGDAYEDTILQIAKDGVSYGIFLVISGAGFSTMEIPSRIADNLRTSICLEMNDKFQYADAMKVVRVETIPEVNVKGRGLAKVGEQILEFQTALCFKADDDFERMEMIKEKAALMSEKWTGRRAMAIPEIPDNPVWSDYARFEETIKLFKDDRHLPIGYNMRNAQPYGIDLSTTYCYLIAGKARSGKTNLLKVMFQSALMKGASVALIDFAGDVSVMSEKEGFETIDTDEKLYLFFNELLPDFKKRNAHKHECVKKGMSDEELYVDMLSYKARFIFIADLADFVEHVMHPMDGTEIKGFVENLLDKGSLHNVFWVACMNSNDLSRVAGTRIYENYVKYKTGIHFGGDVASQRIMNFDYVPYNEQSKAQKSGVGMIPDNEFDDVRKVMVPLMKG